MITDPDGRRWGSYREAASLHRVAAGTVRVWRHRGKVRATHIGHRVWVNLDDVADAEQAWRQRVTSLPADDLCPAAGRSPK